MLGRLFSTDPRKYLYQFFAFYYSQNNNDNNKSQSMLTDVAKTNFVEIKLFPVRFNVLNTFNAAILWLDQWE